MQATRGRTQAITQSYREAATQEATRPVVARNELIARAAIILGAREGSILADAIHDHPCKTIVAISAVLCGALGLQEKVLSPRHPTGVAQTQRLMRMRIYGQAAILATTVGVMFVGEALGVARSQS